MIIGRAGTAISVLSAVCFCLAVGSYGFTQDAFPYDTASPDTMLVQALIDSSYERSYSNPDRAIAFAEQALELSERLGYRRGQAAAHGELGYAWSVKGSFEKSLKHFEEGIALNREIGDSLGLVSQLNDLGTLYSDRSRYEKALEYYFESLKLCEAIGLERGVSATLSNIGLAYFELDEDEQALRYYRRALENNKRNGNRPSLATNYNNIGLLYGDQGQHELSLQYHMKALELRRELGYTLRVANSLNNIGRLKMQQKQFEEAKNFLQRAREVNGGEDKNLSSIIHENLAKTYRAAGRYDSALVHAGKTLALSREFGTQLGVKVAYELLTDLYRRLGQYQKAFSSQRKLMAVKDSILNAEKARQINELQTRYETEKKEKEIALLEKEKQREALLRNAFLAGLLLVGIIGVLVYNRQRLKIRKSRAELENRRLKQQQLRQDLEFRNRQLTTHTLHLVQKNGTMLELKEKIGELKKQSNGETDIRRSLRKLENLVDYSFHLDEDWEQFRLCFEEVHPGFFDALKERFPELTPNELRLSALARLNLSVKETAAVMGITPDSVKTARYRLRKKLDIQTEENLTEFMMEIGGQGDVSHRS